ncbi:MAG TPA: hypothetical protein VM164_13465 [Burkholderiales bacterium]|nr:hypothetical protein [Burkholderiales bacterium]
MAVDEEDAPLGLLLEDAAPPLIPLVVPDEVPPVPLVELLPGLVVVLDDEELGELGTTVVDDEDEPLGTGTTTVSLVELVDELAGGVALPPGGITVVVSFFSQADSANAPIRTNR